MTIAKPRCGSTPRLSLMAAAASAALLGLPQAQAFQFDTGNPDLKISWDNTLKYGTAFRLKNQNAQLLADPQHDDGNRNFNKGLISNRLDLLTEADIQYGGFGARISGSAWYDAAYNGSTDNTSPTTYNALSVNNTQFPEATKKLHGRKGELLDAFVFGKFDIGVGKLTFRAGRHTLLWGESLFLGGNAIAGAQAAIDVSKALSVPNTPFKELGRPTNQLSTQLQFNPDFSLGAYVKFKSDQLRLPGAGSYFSDTDFLGAGGEQILGPGFTRAADMKAKNSGQGGVQARFHVGEYDLGLYAIRYHDFGPQLYINPVAQQFTWVYPQGAVAYAASASTTIGPVNYAVEASVRRNVAFNSVAGIDPTGTGDNAGNPLYAIGKSAHVNLSWLASIGQNWLAKEADFVGEVAWNRRLSVDKNESALDLVANGGNSDDMSRDAMKTRMVYEPKYRQALDGLDITVPMGFGIGVYGNSSLGGNQRKGVGDMSIGLTGAYLDVWRFSATLTHYYGRVGVTKYDQTLKDRDFLSLQVRRTF